MRVQAGTTIFTAGDPSHAVYMIEDGEVAITVGEAPHATEVARLHAGALFGETGVLEARPRAATATAVTDTTLLETDAEIFRHAFGLTNDRALVLLKLLCARLRTTTRRLAEQEPEREPTPSPPMLRLEPDDDRLMAQFNLAPIAITQLPFQVGNRFGGETLPLASSSACCITAHGDPDLAAPHFEILRRNTQLGVRDLGSRFGTIVNGTTLSRTSLTAFCPLAPGANSITAGRPGSAFRFRLLVPG